MFTHAHCDFTIAYAAMFVQLNVINILTNYEHSGKLR